MNKNKVKKICPACNITFFTYPYLIKMGYGIHCSSKCYGITKRGYTPNKNQLNALKKGRGWNKGVKMPQMSGERHPNWKGGINPVIIKIRTCFEYKQWRTAVFERDGYRCTSCLAKNGFGKRVVLNADHFPIPFSKIIADNKITSYKSAISCPSLWNISNGRTLCTNCHKTATKLYMQLNWSNQFTKNHE